jgi:site-specific DNA-cytosine methylase
MNVLSLFDGLSCGQLALNRACIKYDKYFASEVDKYAIAVTQHNFPKTIQLGDVLQVRDKDLPKIDLLIGGSPCQGFSFAGKQLNFDDPRSKLFFEFVRLLEECQPKYFLLENVKMKKEYQDVISNYLGVEPIEINSALISAQNRKRLYWANIPVTQPEDKGILLKDVLEYGEVDRDKSYCIDANYFKGTSVENYKKKARRQLVIVDALYKSRKERIYKEKCCTLRHNCGQLNVVENEKIWRKLTPIECERLQTVPDNYTLVPHPVYKDKMMSNSQRYKMLGNGWTVDVIVHIFKNIT